MASARRSRAPRRPRIPPAAVRATRGPQPPDAIIAGLQELIRNEFATVVLPRVLAEFDRARTDRPARQDALPDFSSLAGLFSARILNAVRSAAGAIAQAARAGVSRAVRPERSTRIPVVLPDSQRREAGYVERVESSVNGSRLAAVLTEAVERATRAGAEPSRGEIERAVGAAATSAASAVKAETNALHAEYTEGYSKAAGLTKYVWTSQLDEIVRPGHARLEGTVQLWSERPIAGDDGHRAHPGEDRFCRCVAFPWDDEPQTAP